MPDQIRFAELSGDHNPLHLDALAARRREPGAPVAHGMHAILWALDELARAAIVGERLSAIRVQFRKFIYLDRPLDLKLVRRDAETITAELAVAELTVASLMLRNGARSAANGAVAADCPEISIANVPNAPNLDEVAQLSGWLTPAAAAGGASGAAWAGEFPHLARVLGADGIAELALLSALVGMVCPGLHSIFTGFSVELTRAAAGARAGIGFKVTLAHRRTRLINMAAAGRAIAGTVTAFMVAPPVAAPAMQSLSKLVGAQDFAETVALIVGGSRGLGAVTAKAIAAGGGSVIVTYAVGRDEALQVAAEINAARGEAVCTTLAYDCNGSAAAQLASLSETVNQIYHYATPPIFQQKPQVFSAELFRTFSRVYVDAFYELCQFVRSRSRAPTLAAFYPSSIAVERRPAGLTEYAMAKAAGEILCADMSAHMPGLRVFVSRLPRVLTDQTNTIAQVENADPLTVLLPLIRAVHGLA